MRPVEARLRELFDGPLVVLQNTRFEAGETADDPGFAQFLADGQDLFVQDAFGSVHRAHASTVGVARLLDTYAGLLLERELDHLGRLLDEVERPFVLVSGGATVEDKIGVLHHVGARADMVLIGGKMAAQLNRHETLGFPIELPVDVVAAAEMDRDAEARICPADEVPEGWLPLDIGPETRRRYASHCERQHDLLERTNGRLRVAEVRRWQGSGGQGRRGKRRVLGRRRSRLTARTQRARARRSRVVVLDRRWRGARVARGQGAARRGCHPVPGRGMTGAPYQLILLRHGESEWNRRGLFTGWVDVGLSEAGVREAQHGGELRRESGLLPDVVHTSLLTRAIRTTELALAAADRCWIPVRRSWRLNERHYGALQGKNKEQTRLEFGDEQIMLWRHSYDVPPPPLDAGQASGLRADARYRDLAPDVVPYSECLKDVVRRLLPYCHDAIVPDLRSGGVVLVSAHGNSLRALVKHLDEIADEEIAELNLPTGVPLLYELYEKLTPLGAFDPELGISGAYLDIDAATASIAVVRRQGATIAPAS
jgi:2,3-bisphosphoglycerate-dependent phosphoglycerate mutase